MDETTAWNKNTPLHIAVKNVQIKAVKTLVWDLKANTKAENTNGNTPIDFCNKFVKDESTNSTIMGLLKKMSQNTKVIKNLDAKRAKDAKKKAEDQEIQKLKCSIKAAIEKKGYDLEKMFKLFDTNGDGTFDQMEFEAAFNVLDIEVKVADLRRFIALGDKNNDGKIDYPEFHEMLYG